MANLRAGFLTGVVNIVNLNLQYVDAWDALKREFDTFPTNGITIDQTDVDALGIPGLTVAQVNAALTAQQEVVDYNHVATRAVKLYRLKK